MGSARFLVGDCFDRMAELEDGSVDLILTSPPFLALRSYLPADHPDKGREIGSEPSPAAFLDTLLALTGEWRRLLAPHGSICVELGDTYAGSTGGGGDYQFRDVAEGERQTRRESFVTGDVQPNLMARKGAGWPLDKSLCGIPHLYHLSLAYGRNLLTGEPSPAGAWRVRNVVAWCRPNPPVGALGDKFRPGTSYLTVATIARDRYFDLDAVRTAQTEPDRTFRKAKDAERDDGWGRAAEGMQQNPAGAPPLDWWEIPTHPFPGAHYATWPPALCVKPIESMCPRRVCRVCGQPSRRIVESSGDDSTNDIQGGPAGNRLGSGRNGDPGRFGTAANTTTGWSDCGHDDFRNGLVLDPFAGSGTTLAVATGHGRDAIGIDLDPRNADLAVERIGGLFLTIEAPAVPA